MSYFVFGLIDAPRLDVIPVRAVASREGIDAKLGDDVRQGILIKMVGAHLPTSVPFLLTKLLTDDTSDSLVSPYTIGIEASARAFEAIGRWVSGVLQFPQVECVRLWMTEGFDSSFERLEVLSDQLAHEVGRRILEEGDVPSLELSIHR